MMRTIYGLLLTLAGIAVLVMHLLHARTAADISILVCVFALVLATVGIELTTPGTLARWASTARGFLPAKWTGKDGRNG